MHCVPDRYPALFCPATYTMHLFMWQQNTVGVAHYIMVCLMPLMMLLMVHQPHLYQPWRLDKCEPLSRP